MSVVSHMANNLREKKQYVRPVTEMICHASYSILFFSTHNLLVFHAKWLFWQVFEKRNKEFFKHSEKYIDFLTENFLFVCSLQTLLPQLDETDATQICKRWADLNSEFCKSVSIAVTFWTEWSTSPVCPGHRAFLRQCHCTTKIENVPGQPGLAGHSRIQRHWSASVNIPGSIPRQWGPKSNIVLGLLVSLSDLAKECSKSIMALHLSVLILYNKRW